MDRTRDAKQRAIFAGDEVQVIKDGVIGRVIDILGEDGEDDENSIELMIFTSTGGTVIERAVNVNITRTGR